MPKNQIDQDILRFCQAIWLPGEVREIRAFNARGYVDYGYFDEPATAARAAWRLRDTHEVYITLNPCNPALLARSENKIRQAGKKNPTTSDRDIAALRLVLVDVDPKRPAGISASSEELEEASIVAGAIREHLGEPLVFGLSGNGYHLIYLHSMTSQDQLRSWLIGLNDRFGTDLVGVDLAVHNPARITKVLGTWARKGDCTDDRPHRQSRVIAVNPDSQPVAWTPAEPEEREVIEVRSDPKPQSGKGFDVREFLARHNVTVIDEKPWNSSTLLRLEACIFDSSHKHPEASVVLQPSGRLLYQCFHESCKGRTWREAREKIDPGGKKEKKKKKLKTPQYMNFFAERGWDFRMNDLNDRVYWGDQPMTDPLWAVLRNRLRDDLAGSDLKHASDAVIECAHAHRFHPIKDYLEGAKWDGHDRLAGVCSCIISKDDLFSRWFKSWLVGAVARVYEGGRNAVLVLGGRQEIGKSFFARWLCPIKECFRAAPISPEQKDDRLRLAKTWIWEIEELGATTRRADVEALKSFLTHDEVCDRKSYGKEDMEKPALTSFIGTINPDGAGFLADRTGNSRFMVAEIREIDWKYTEIDLAQLWAQALHIYRSGADWRLSVEDRIARDFANVEHLSLDPVEEILISSLEFTGDGNEYVMISDILERLSDTLSINHATTRSVASFMAREGAVSCRISSDGSRARGYRGVRWAVKTGQTGQMLDR